MFKKKTVMDVDVKGKRVLVRVDFNVPLENGVIGDDTRIRAAIPTIQYLLEQGAAVILCSHLGRPKGKPNEKYSLKPIAAHLADLLKKPIKFAEDCIGIPAEEASRNLKPGEVLLLENTRFHEGEEKNDAEMARQLASLADVFVNDAFGTAHRAHASTAGVADYLPAVAGFLLEKEIKYLGEAIAAPERPFIAILGGAKISDKIGVIRNLLVKADQIMIGGAMANTFFRAQGYPTGSSLVEENALDIARSLLADAGKKIRLPIDVVIATKVSADAEYKTMPVGPIDEGWSIVDIGPETVQNYGKAIQKAGSVVWNGPMGVFEIPAFSQGSLGIARAIANSKAVSIAGGGETVAAIQQQGLAGQFTHVSTGGGASLEMLEGLELPGLAVLQDKTT